MFETNFARIWVYLSASPLLGLTVTLMAYGLAHRLYRSSDQHPLLNPVLTAIVLLILFLKGTHTSYEAYFEGGQFVQFLLGPATVALAIPLHDQLSKLRKIWLAVSLTLVAGVVISSWSAILLVQQLGGSLQTQLSIAPKSVTAPVAMGISEKIGGLPSLTAVLVVMTGIFGSVIATQVFAVLRIRDNSAKGIAMGITAHGLGTARAFQINAEIGAFSGLGMALSAFTTALILPWLLEILKVLP
ncbi:LrgB family protein [Lyngbya confervoides]|uniref:LrgB family protein n=1 Tax=Lyngbya confervoides BDU141951 TaxID=1574623 RepID=A0ABD4SYU5_9CYAN|nr:LrgB family protein [Lyngbya confervoides]MCM1981433.1 LrgB family protein [Lyngbya confervoides BDU141951]